ncbi:hypothetical protein MAM1_0361c10032 [Mucor ambiguus]|uniref:Uncharacterized protein n=1 Tax=Mucor ambiguus TaxID=91626 RepID=A0A0C9MI52_9FUNG|nr:hypothetical protein MAM1_0361c10032 [Mucor ambiguus]
MELVKDLYWTKMSYNAHEDEDEYECPSPPISDAYGCYFRKKSHRSGYLKITKEYINNIVPGVDKSFAPNTGEPSTKKRKA